MKSSDNMRMALVYADFGMQLAPMIASELMKRKIGPDFEKWLPEFEEHISTCFLTQRNPGVNTEDMERWGTANSRVLEAHSTRPRIILMLGSKRSLVRLPARVTQNQGSELLSLQEPKSSVRLLSVSSTVTLPGDRMKTLTSLRKESST
jgi:hypothetical protein